MRAQGRAHDEAELEGEGPGLVVDVAPVIRGLSADLRRGHDRAALAAAFHDAIAEMVAEVCLRLAGTTGVRTVGLTGGVFDWPGFRSYWRDALRRDIFDPGFIETFERMNDLDD